jgi:transposase
MEITNDTCIPAGWVGVDVSKPFFDVALWGDQPFSSMVLARFPRTKEGAAACVDWLQKQSRDVAGLTMEWTGNYSRELAEWLQPLRNDWPVSLVNPSLVRSFGKSYGLRNKTDQVDARLLALYGQERKPQSWLKPEQEQDQLRSLFRTRAKLERILVSLRCRKEDGLTPSPVAQDAQAAVIEALITQIKALEQAGKDLMRSHPRMKQDLDLLLSVPGVGPITAMAVMAEAGDLRRFRRGRQLTAFLGVSPRRHQSGTSVLGRTRMCRIGGKFVRPVLYMSAVSNAARNTSLGEFYRRLVGQGKSGRAALGAVMRKTLLVMRAVLIQNAPYQSPCTAKTSCPEAPKARPA